jgi:prophage antirepressor-like protein
MNAVIDIFNNQLVYDKNNINYVIDIENNIWFKFLSVAKLLKYKSSKDALRDLVNKDNKTLLKNIKILIKVKEHPNTVYLNEKGIYHFLMKSRMNSAKDFQEWLINDVLPNLRKHGKYEINKKIKQKLKNLNKKIKKLEKDNIKLKKDMTKNKFPKGSHVYIIEDNGKYKIGYTDDLQKRLQTYNTGSSDKIEYSYYKKTKCGKEVETCLKSMLNKYLYKSNKEFYVCDIDIIIKKILKCIKYETKCSNDNITQQNGGSINSNIIDDIIDYYKTKYEYYNSIKERL